MGEEPANPRLRPRRGMPEQSFASHAAIPGRVTSLLKDPQFLEKARDRRRVGASEERADCGLVAFAATSAIGSAGARLRRPAVHVFSPRPPSGRIHIEDELPVVQRCST
jgi:hypothetical protein